MAGVRLSSDCMREVLKHLDGSDLCSAAAVCRSWRAAAADPDLWCRLVMLQSEQGRVRTGAVASSASLPSLPLASPRSSEFIGVGVGVDTGAEAKRNAIRALRPHIRSRSNHRDSSGSGGTGASDGGEVNAHDAHDDASDARDAASDFDWKSAFLGRASALSRARNARVSWFKVLGWMTIAVFVALLLCTAVAWWLAYSRVRWTERAVPVRVEVLRASLTVWEDDDGDDHYRPEIEFRFEWPRDVIRSPSHANAVPGGGGVGAGVISGVDSSSHVIIGNVTRSSYRKSVSEDLVARARRDRAIQIWVDPDAPTDASSHVLLCPSAAGPLMFLMVSAYIWWLTVCRTVRDSYDQRDDTASAHPVLVCGLDRGLQPVALTSPSRTGTVATLPTATASSANDDALPLSLTIERERPGSRPHRTTGSERSAGDSPLEVREWLLPLLSLSEVDQRKAAILFASLLAYCVLLVAPPLVHQSLWGDPSVRTPEDVAFQAEWNLRLVAPPVLFALYKAVTHLWLSLSFREAQLYAPSRTHLVRSAANPVVVTQSVMWYARIQSVALRFECWEVYQTENADGDTTANERCIEQFAVPLAGAFDVRRGESFIGSADIRFQQTATLSSPPGFAEYPYYYWLIHVDTRAAGLPLYSRKLRFELYDS